MFENEFTWGKAVTNNSTEEFHANFDRAVEEVKQELGQKFPIIINGEEISSEKRFIVKSPADKRITIAEFPKATENDVLNAINSAKNAFDK